MSTLFFSQRVHFVLLNVSKCRAEVGLFLESNFLIFRSADFQTFMRTSAEFNIWLRLSGFGHLVYSLVKRRVLWSFLEILSSKQQLAAWFHVRSLYFLFVKIVKFRKNCACLEAFWELFVVAWVSTLSWNIVCTYLFFLS